MSDIARPDALAAGPALIRSAVVVGARSDRIAADLGLTPLQARILFILTSAPSNLIGLGTELLLVKSTMTGVIRRMETAGLIERATDPRDRRNAVLAPTSRGAELAITYRDRMREMALDLLAPLDSAQRSSLGQSLTAVIARAEEPSRHVLPGE